MRRHWSYFKYVFWHKVRVFQAGRKFALPFWTLFWHDWHKFLPDEFFPYARTFYNSDGSPRPYQMPEDHTFLEAWALHQKRSKHHWQYWLRLGSLPMHRIPHLLVMDRGDFLDTEGGKLPAGGLVPEEMPLIYVREMLADWASFAPDDRQKQRDWWEKTKDQKILHPETRKMIEGWFTRA